MKIEENEHYIQLLSNDEDGDFQVRITKALPIAQLQLDTEHGDAYACIDRQELEALRDMANKVLGDHEDLSKMKMKAEKWDKLADKISKCYCNSDGEYDEDNPEIEGADLLTIGEMAANAFGWL